MASKHAAAQLVLTMMNLNHWRLLLTWNLKGVTPDCLPCSSYVRQAAIMPGSREAAKLNICRMQDAGNPHTTVPSPEVR